MLELVFWSLASWAVYEVAIRVLNELRYRKHVRDWERHNDAD